MKSLEKQDGFQNWSCFSRGSLLLMNLQLDTTQKGNPPGGGGILLIKLLVDCVECGDVHMVIDIPKSQLSLLWAGYD